MSDFIDDFGQWNSDLVFAQLPLDAAMKVIAYPLPRVGSLADTYVWASTSNGKFSTRSAYLNLLREAGTCLASNISWLWKLSIPSRWLYFLWLAWRGRLLTNGLRCRWALSDDASCVLCGPSMEDVLHVLRDCHEAKMVWEQVLPNLIWLEFSSLTLEEWLQQNLDMVRNIELTFTEICRSKRVL